MINLVLATDMKQHFAILSIFQTKLVASGHTSNSGSNMSSQPLSRSNSQDVGNVARRTIAEAKHADEDMCTLVLQVRATLRIIVGLPPCLLFAGDMLCHSVAHQALMLDVSNTDAIGFIGVVGVVGGWGALERLGINTNCCGMVECYGCYGILCIERNHGVLQVVLKCADLGHLTCPWAVHRRWVHRLQAEFFLQGDKEREAGLPVSPLMDCNKMGITKSQVRPCSISRLQL